MSDIPGDPWAALLVGHQWPGASALATLSEAAASRQTVGTAFHGYADTLRSISNTVLRDQDGLTADSIRSSFHHGENHARGVAERNAAKNAALSRAHRCAAELRSALSEIAGQGAGRIHSIIEGAQPTPAKIAAIVEVVQGAQTDADTRAASCMQEVYGSIQHVLDTSGHETSARQFAHAHGVAQGTAHRAPDPDALHRQVQQLLEKHVATALPVAEIVGRTLPTASGDQVPSTPIEEHITPVATSVTASVTASGTATPGHAVRPVIAEMPPRTAAQPAARPLLPYGAESGRAPTEPVAAPGSAPRTTTPTAGPTTAAAVLTRAVPRTVERARSPFGPERDLRTLLYAVARQQPMVRWAISTPDAVLATDMASGWIPPHIDIPAGVGLLEPAVRDGDLTGWFGAAGTAITHDPGAALPPPGDPVQMSDRASPHVEDLGWKIVQATRWRDGLPRLTHTAAKAAAASLDLLPSEMTRLRTDLRAAGDRVVAGYPDSMNAGDIGNWQLLAAVEALINGEIGSARYHFAWFETRNQEVR